MHSAGRGKERERVRESETNFIVFTCNSQAPRVVHIGWQASVFCIRIQTWTQATTEANTLRAVCRDLLYILLMKWWRGAAHDDWTKAMERKKGRKKKQELGSQNSHMNAFNVFCAPQCSCYLYIWRLFIMCTTRHPSQQSGAATTAAAALVLGNEIMFRLKQNEERRRKMNKKVVWSRSALFCSLASVEITMMALMMDGDSEDGGSIWTK